MKMKTLSIVLPLLVFCYFEAISARGILNSKFTDVRKWVDIKLGDINEQCERNVNYTISYDTYTNYKQQMLKFLDPIDKNTCPRAQIFKSIYNPDMIDEMKDLIEHIQNCLDEDNRLDSKELRTVFGNTLHLHALRVAEVQPLTREDVKACEENLENKADECKNTYKNILHTEPSQEESTTIFDLLTGNFVGRSSCEDILPLEQCLMKAMGDCSHRFKKMLKVMLSPPEVIVCKSFLQETDEDINNGLKDIFNEEKVTPIMQLGLEPRPLAPFNFI